MSDQEPLSATLLPSGIRARMLDGVNGLRMHVLEAGDPTAPLVLLLHGFPELAYSWRNVMPTLAASGYRVVAPDLRGYGRTTGWDTGFDCDLTQFGLLSCVRDMLALIARLGRDHAALLVGHDFGSVAAAACALIRPDMFRSVALMSAPFAGVRPWPSTAPGAETGNIQFDLTQLEPPRKHYHYYYSTPDADAEMTTSAEGVHDFLRAYFHYKSADWAGNAPEPLADASAASLARLPTYYVMNLHETMPQTVAPYLPPRDAVAACQWLSEDALSVYSAEYGRTGFQGGLNWYRGRTGGLHARELSTFAGRTIDVPAAFIAGRQDWGVFQTYGAFDAMQQRGCTDLRLCELLDGAGHWVQQERADAVGSLLTDFLRNVANRSER